jgi:hypothetical protein
VFVARDDDALVKGLQIVDHGPKTFELLRDWMFKGLVVIVVLECRSSDPRYSECV